MTSSLFSPHGLQSFSTSLSKFSLVYHLAWHPPLHTPYISSPNHYLLFAAHAHTIATCFAVVPRLCHLILVSLSTLYFRLYLVASRHTSILPFSSLPSYGNFCFGTFWLWPSTAHWQLRYHLCLGLVTVRTVFCLCTVRMPCHLANSVVSSGSILYFTDWLHSHLWMCHCMHSQVRLNLISMQPDEKLKALLTNLHQSLAAKVLFTRYYSMPFITWRMLWRCWLWCFTAVG